MKKKAYVSPKFVEFGSSVELTLGYRDGDCLEAYAPYMFAWC